MLFLLAKSHQTDILPVFITCDPARDDVKAVKTYVKGELDASPFFAISRFGIELRALFNRGPVILTLVLAMPQTSTLPSSA